VGGDCDAWGKFTRDPLYKEWAEGKCGAKVHTDPCSCTFLEGAPVQCTDGRITYLDMDNSGLPGGVIPLALLDLTGLQSLSIGGDGLTGTIPSAIGQLQQLSTLVLWVNGLHGTIPHEVTTLHKLVNIALGGANGNHFTGVLPAFNFSQFTVGCVLDNQDFTCPLPAGADTCLGCPKAHVKSPPPSCK
jgi:hypothetical protein